MLVKEKRVSKKLMVENQNSKYVKSKRTIEKKTNRHLLQPGNYNILSFITLKKTRMGWVTKEVAVFNKKIKLNLLITFNKCYNLHI